MKNEYYQARVNVAIVRLYGSAEDLMPNGKFIERGEILQTDCSVDLYDGSCRLRITEPDDYAGLWIDKSVCDLIPVTVKHPEKLQSDDELVSIYVKKDNPIIYKSGDSQTPIESKLKAGSVLTCSERIETVANGIHETRYHIVSSPDDSTIADYWILSNSKINDPLANRVINIPTKVSLSPVDLTAPISPPVKKTVRRMMAKARSVDVNVDDIKDEVSDAAQTAGKKVGDIADSEKGPIDKVVINVNEVNIKGDLKWVGDITASTKSAAETAEEIAANAKPNESANSSRTYEVDTDKPTNADYTDPAGTGNTVNTTESVDEEVLKERTNNIDNNAYDGKIFQWNNEDSDDTLDEDYDYYTYNYGYNQETMQGLKLSRIGYVHGMPFQYTALTDRRSYSEAICGEEDDNSDQYGRSFAQEIVSNTPIVVFAPGEPKFLSAISEGLMGKIFDPDRKDLEKKLRVGYTNGFDSEEELQDMIESSSNQYDFFTMEINTTEYFKYVNSMTRLLAKNMGLSGRTMGLGAGGKKRCDLVDWGKYNADVDRDSKIDEVLGLDGGVSFAYDAQSSVSDSINTSTGDSELASQLNQASSKVREINFLMGAAAGKQFLSGTEVDFGESGGSSVDSVLGRLGSLVNNTISGMNVRFPEIWQDSSSSKDYSLDMRFIAPYATSFCIWRYVLVPFVHILALAAPRSTRQVNSYVAPFLIRAFSKGYFNVEMGIITSITWKRFGDGDMISADGVPTQIDVTVDFKDLYHSLTISPWKTSNLGLFFNNTGLIDLLGTLSGVNMNRMSMMDRLSLYGFAFKESVTDMGTNLMRHVNDRVRNTFDNFFNVR